MIFLHVSIIGRLECVSTQLEVFEELGITHSVISRLWQRFLDDGNVSRSYTADLPRVTTPNEDRYLAVTAKKNRQSTASNLSRQPSSTTGTTFSRQAMDRCREQIGLYARRLSDMFHLLQWRNAHPRIAGARDCSFWRNYYGFQNRPSCSNSNHDRPNLSGYGHRICVYGLKRPSVPSKHRKRLPSIGGYHPYGRAIILTVLESSRECVGHTWPMSCSPSATSYRSTAASKSID
ncbi:nibrin [Trichonephila clavipes]|nr:nibrin [Trichonephila clavipes]